MEHFYYFVKDLDLLKAVHTIVDELWTRSENVIVKTKEEIPANLVNGLIFVDSELEYFQDKFLNPEKSNVVVVVNDIVNDFADYPYEVYISRNRVLGSLTAILYDLKNTHEFDQKYFSVHIKNIMVGEIAPCDLYLRLNESKFVKILSTDTLFDYDVLDRYKDKTEFFWVAKEDFFLFGNFLYGEEDLDLKVTAPFSADNTNHLKLVYTMARSCGISESTMNMVSNSVESFQQNSSNKLKDLLSKIEDISDSYLVAHSHLTAFLCAELTKRESWAKPQHTDKLILASIVHDLGFKNHLNSVNEGMPKSKLMQMDPEAKEDIFSHIDNVLDILKDCDEIDSDIINIIKRHHGARGEDSYPQVSHATEFDLLSGAFILCHSFAVSLFKMDLDVTKYQKILAYINLIYNKGNIKKNLPAFNTMIQEIFSASK